MNRPPLEELGLGEHFWGPGAREPDQRPADDIEFIDPESEAAVRDFELIPEGPDLPGNITATLEQPPPRSGFMNRLFGVISIPVAPEDVDRVQAQIESLNPEL